MPALHHNRAAPAMCRRRSVYGAQNVVVADPGVEIGLQFLDPDLRVREVIHLISARFREIGSAPQVLLQLVAKGVHFPRPSDSKGMVSFEGRTIRYRNVIAVLKNPFYTGADGRCSPAWSPAGAAAVGSPSST